MSSYGSTKRDKHVTYPVWSSPSPRRAASTEERTRTCWKRDCFAHAAKRATKSSFLACTRITATQHSPDTLSTNRLLWVTLKGGLRCCTIVTLLFASR